jgi:hypothetical protein
MKTMDLEKQVQSTLSKLNFVERNSLNNYIRTKTMLEISKAQEALQQEATEKEEHLKELNENAWDKISNYLTIALKKNHISDERTKKIYKTMLDIDDLGISNVNATSKDIKVLSIKDFEDLIELAIDTSCRNCKHQHKHCSVYQILKRYDVPKPSGYKAKCKYGYGGTD